MTIGRRWSDTRQQQQKQRLSHSPATLECYLDSWKRSTENLVHISTESCKSMKTNKRWESWGEALRCGWYGMNNENLYVYGTPLTLSYEYAIHGTVLCKNSQPIRWKDWNILAIRRLQSRMIKWSSQRGSQLLSWLSAQ